MTASLGFETIAQISAGQIVDSLLEGTLIALFAGGMLRLSWKQASGTRFAVWFSALMAIAALPLLKIVSLPRTFASAGNRFHPALTLPGSWALYLFATWAVIASWLLCRVVVGLWHIYALRKTCLPVDLAQIDPGLLATLECNRGARRVMLSFSESVQVPTAIGLISPAVVIPQWLSRELTPDELNQVLLHELAHLRRWDDWTNLVQKIVKALFFFHPAVWWIEKEVSLEREMACDDAVLAVTAQPHAYAECLARLAEKTFLRRSLSLAQAALGHIRQTSMRVAKILDAGRPRGTKRIWVPAVSLIAGVAFICAVFASREPNLIAFEDGHVHAGKVELARGLAAADLAPGPATKSVVTASPVQRTIMPERPRMVLAKNTIANPTHPRASKPAQKGFVLDPQVMAPDFLHLTSFGATSFLSTDAVFLFVTGPGPDAAGPQIYEIRIWRLTVFHPALPSVSKPIPRKET
ncbi:MAG TPA: M56 family metallopeptidase [Verrucomicrobiae bacterium]|nr:M56 family metallopeptidase [Verrucomicrobiae bacterium]